MAPKPTLVVITGAQAVGKMTVGQALSRRTGMPLFFNHQIIDVVTPYFAFGTPQFDRIVEGFWDHLLESAAETAPGLIVTWAWRFNEPEDAKRVQEMTAPFAEHGRICVAELYAPLEVRLQRNLTENRRAHKQLGWATEDALRELSERYEYRSGGRLPLDLPHFELDVTELSPETASARIAEAFQLPSQVDEVAS